MSPVTTIASPAQSPSHAESPARFAGLLAEYTTPDALLAAARRVRESGFTRWDCHTPYPVHGIDGAMGIVRTRLPLFVFACGLTGAGLALLMQWWMNAFDYPFIISGKPYFSLPAFIPVMFEVTVLLSAIGTVLGMLMRNNLPEYYTPLFHSARFRRATDDRFFLAIDSRDARFDRKLTRKLLDGTNPVAVEELQERGTLSPPAWIPKATVCAAIALLIPLAVVAYMRVDKSTEPRLHPIQDMDNQPRFAGKQMASAMFADGRATRPAPAGTIARGDLARDTHYFEGRSGERWVTTFPMYRDELRALAETDDGSLSRALVLRGQNRFNIYCAACHGFDGAGNGRVNALATEKELGWVPPKNLHDEDIRGRPVGHLFHTITHGIRTMPPYGDQLAPQDRWAIVAYVRSLQLSPRLDGAAPAGAGAEKK